LTYERMVFSHLEEIQRLPGAFESAKDRKTFAELARIWLRLAFVFQQTQPNQPMKQEPARADRLGSLPCLTRARLLQVAPGDLDEI
jgi:hypothetical protein